MGAVVVVGIGELGAVFARGFLKSGHVVFPVTRQARMAEVARSVPEPGLVLVAVGETDLSTVLADLPAEWRGRVGLLQNELLPGSWRAHDIASPTVVVVWFEKKPTTLVKELLPTFVFGPGTSLVREALGAVGIATRALDSEADLLFELARKNLYILTTNIAGIEHGGTVMELWHERKDLALRVAKDVLALQSALVGVDLPEAALIGGLAEAIAADPAHACTGRSAPARLTRALTIAEQLRVPVPELRRIAERST
jgi:hypothetical protein